jgi:hypothetical protein
VRAGGQEEVQVQQGYHFFISTNVGVEFGGNISVTI